MSAKKREFNDEVEYFKKCNLYQVNKPRLMGLIDTLKVINNNLPFRHGEYRESRLQMELGTIENMKTTLYAKTTKHFIVEIYAAAKVEAKTRIKNILLDNFPTIALSSDFWTMLLLKTKFVGIRIKFIKNAKRDSILLGVRHLNPSFIERTVAGLTPTYRRWIDTMLEEFGLKPTDLYSSSSVKGTDVKHMMPEILKLQWEWCVPHMTNAVTKRAFGITKNYNDLKNPDMTKFIQKCVRLIFVVKSSEKFGSLYKECQTMFANDQTGNCVQMIGFAQHRFMSIYKMLQRIITLWTALEFFSSLEF